MKISSSYFKFILNKIFFLSQDKLFLGNEAIILYQTFLPPLLSRDNKQISCCCDKRSGWHWLRKHGPSPTRRGRPWFLSNVCNGDRTGEGGSGDINLEPMEIKTASKQNRCHVQSLSLNSYSERQYILAIDVVLRNL